MTQLDEKALEAAKTAYDRKYADMSSPYPTEEPDAGGGPLGYAILAYLDEIGYVAEEPVLDFSGATAVGGINHSPPMWKLTHCINRHICPDVLAGIPCRGPCASSDK